MLQRMMRERGEGVPPEDALDAAQRIKEEHCYVSQDLVKEFGKYDADPTKYFKKFVGRNSRNRTEYTADIGYERFLAAELFFNPEIYSSDFTKPLPEVVDESILSCPIDTRKGLYRNIVLSGGSTMFTNFHRRLQGDIKDRVQVCLHFAPIVRCWYSHHYPPPSHRVQARIDANLRKLRTAPSAAPDLKVKVVSHDMQRYAVWFGGSMLGCTPEFYRVCHTKAQYQEEGPRIARHNPVFQVSM
jgi:actin-related protein 3